MRNGEEKTRSPLLSWSQLLIIVVVVIALVVSLDLSAKAQAGREQTTQETILENLLETEEARQQHLIVTLTYVSSDDYVADYARNEAGMLLPEERRVVSMPHPLPLTPTPMPTPIPVIVVPQEPWQAWWMLFFDSPPPGK